MGTGENSLNKTSYALRSRIVKWDLRKLQSFCKTKDTVNRTKQQPTNLEKIFTNPTSHRGPISNIYKGLKKLDSRDPNSHIKKWCTELNKEFSPEQYQLAEKHVKKCSTSLVIREMQIKTSLRFYLTPVRMTKIKKLRRQQVLERMWRKRNTPPLLVGLQADTTTLEISFAVPQKTGHNIIRRPCYTSPGHIPRGFPSK